MSFEATMSKAVEDFKAKFAGQHREAMWHEFATARSMMEDAHKSLNDTERALGMVLTPIYSMNLSVDVAKREVDRGYSHKGTPKNRKLIDIKKASRLIRAVQETHSGTQANRKARTELEVEFRKLSENHPFTGISLALGRSKNYVSTFLYENKRMGLS